MQESRERYPDRAPARSALTVLSLAFMMFAAGCGGGGSGSSTTQNPSTASHSVTLNWTASTSPTVSGYRVYRRPDNSQAYDLLTTAPVGTLRYVDLNVQVGQTYNYAVTAVDNQLSESPTSDEAVATVPQ